MNEPTDTVLAGISMAEYVTLTFFQSFEVGQLTYRMNFGKKFQKTLEPSVDALDFNRMIGSQSFVFWQLEQEKFAMR